MQKRARNVSGLKSLTHSDVFPFQMLTSNLHTIRNLFSVFPVFTLSVNGWRMNSITGTGGAGRDGCVCGDYNECDGI